MTKITKATVKVIGIVQCDYAKERCSGFGCVNSFAQRIDAFAKYPADSAIMVVPFECGGCPGRRIGRSAAHLAKRAKKKANVEKDEIIIHLASCMTTDNGHYPPCPHLDYIMEILRRKGMKVKMGSYKSKTAQKKRDEGVYKRFDWEGEAD